MDCALPKKKVRLQDVVCAHLLVEVSTHDTLVQNDSMLFAADSKHIATACILIEKHRKQSRVETLSNVGRKYRTPIEVKSQENKAENS